MINVRHQIRDDIEKHNYLYGDTVRYHGRDSVWFEKMKFELVWDGHGDVDEGVVHVVLNEVFSGMTEINRHTVIEGVIDQMKEEIIWSTSVV